MRQKLGNIGEVDLLTADELHVELSDAVRQLQGGPRRVRGAMSGKTDAAGALDMDVYDVSVGGQLALSRLLIRADNATAGVPVVAAAGFINLLRSGLLIDFYGVAKVVGGLALPLRDTWGNHEAPLIRNGEILQVQVRGYTANMGVTVEIQGWEDRIDV